ncbi:Phosphorylase superfamily [Phytophthora infestans]|uniref:Phosphorylase superfamily n=1 Tax=Phytophthora infestans TaxID=4787 RepID=A0A833WCE4_PHYIN|nr:Phosphorylase superfamily [Phytophthora infestans]
MAYLDTNAMPRRSDGTVLHLGVKAGQVANRVVSVGSLERAKLLAQLLDGAQFETIESARGFKTFTGKMFGTCGVVREEVPPGSVVVSGKGSVMVTRNPDAFFLMLPEKNTFEYLE